MGLFSGLKGKGIEALNLHSAVMVPIVAAMLADGEIDDDEVDQIRSVCRWSPIYARNTREQDNDITLADHRGWSIVCQSSSGKLFVRRGSCDTHDFHERPRDRFTAIEIAKAWIDRR